MPFKRSAEKEGEKESKCPHNRARLYQSPPPPYILISLLRWNARARCYPGSTMRTTTGRRPTSLAIRCFDASDTDNIFQATWSLSTKRSSRQTPQSGRAFASVDDQSSHARAVAVVGRGASFPEDRRQGRLSAGRHRALRAGATAGKRGLKSIPRVSEDSWCGR